MRRGTPPGMKRVLSAKPARAAVLLIAAPAALMGAPAVTVGGRAPWEAAFLAKARQAGFADLSDSQQPLSRERFVRRAVRADGLKLRRHDPAPGTAGIAGTRAPQDSSRGAADSAGTVDLSDCTGTDGFGGLEAKPRAARADAAAGTREAIPG